MKRKDQRADGPDLLTRRTLAEQFGVHPMTVTKWERDGLPVAYRGRKGKPSLYDPAACRAWMEARETAAEGSPVDLFRERARKERAQALLVEQTYAVRAKKLLPADEVDRAWSAEQAAVRAKLLALSQTYADRLARAVTQHGIAGAERAIREMADEVLTELAAGPVRQKQNMTVFAVFDPADLVMEPKSSDELMSIWSTKELADAEARRLSDLDGYTFIVREIEVDLIRRP